MACKLLCGRSKKSRIPPVFEPFKTFSAYAPAIHGSIQAQNLVRFPYRLVWCRLLSLMKPGSRRTENGFFSDVVLSLEVGLRVSALASRPLGALAHGIADVAFVAAHVA